MVKSLSIAVVCACMVSCAATTSEQEVTHSDFVPEGYELVWNDDLIRMPFSRIRHAGPMRPVEEDGVTMNFSIIFRLVLLPIR